jgi:hypothetical protein
MLTFMPLLVRNMPQVLQSTIQTLCKSGAGGAGGVALGACGNQPGARDGCADH